MKEEIIVKGAKENNLKNVDVTIPRNKLTVFTLAVFAQALENRVGLFF